MKKILWIGPNQAFARRYLSDNAIQLSFVGSAEQVLDNWASLFENDQVADSPKADMIIFDRINGDLPALLSIRSRLLAIPTTGRIPFVLVSSRTSAGQQRLARKLRAADSLEGAIEGRAFRRRIFGLLEREGQMAGAEPAAMEVHTGWGIPLWKRAFDIIGSLVLILLLLPLFMLVALLVKLESRGPVFYISKRIGQGFRPFDFYKFRSMRVGASSQVKELKESNQYAGQGAGKAAEAAVANVQLVRDDGLIPESSFQMERARLEGQTFFKVKDDPRITWVGRIIRSTSIDELPQLFNVLKGDMSLVGNRPLPLYEAEKLTSDEWVFRFKAPAGITGLWQVSGRGKANMSEDERKQFDIEYARNYGLWLDLKILWKTLPAAVQEVNV